MASRELRVEIIGDSRSLQRALGNATDSTSKFGGSMAKMGKMAAVGLAALGVGAAVAGKKMIELASDAAEVDSKLKVVFGASLPELTDNLDKFSEATGASRFALREQAADMGALLVPLSKSKKAAADMSEQFVKLATDLGSFNNVPVEDALLAIRSGLVGEAEPLRRFGVLLNEAAVKAEAYRLGITKVGKELTEQEKVQARASLIMKQTTLAQGDAERTAGSMANQMKALRNNVTDMATSLGTLLIPYALAAAKAFNENWPTIEKVIRGVVVAIVSTIQAIATAVSFLKGQWEIHRESAIATWEAVRDAVLRFVNWFRSNVVPAIQNVIKAVMLVWNNFGSEIKTVLSTILTVVKTFVQNFLAPFKVLFALLRGDFGAAWDEIKGVFTRSIDAIVAVLRGAVTVWLGLAKALGMAIINGILGVLTSIGEKIKSAVINPVVNALSSAINAVKNAALRVALAIIEPFTHLPSFLGAPFRKAKDAINASLGVIKSEGSSRASTAGSSIGQNFVAGLNIGMLNAARAAYDTAMSIVAQVAAVMASAAEARSPSRLTERTVGKPLMEGVALGIGNSVSATSERAYEAVRTVTKRMAQAARDQQATLAAAFATLADNALAAFDAKVAAWTPPSLKKLEAMRAAQREKDIEQEIAEALEAVTKAQTAAAAVAPIGLRQAPSEAFLQAEADLAAAQARLEAANLAKRELELERQAVIEQEAFNKRAAAARAELLAEIKKLAPGIGSIRSAAAALADALADAAAAISGAVGGGGGAPGKAAGGPVKRGRTYLVGERGPELFTAPSSGRIIPNGGARMATAGGPTFNITIPVHGNVMTERDLIATVEEGLLRSLRINGKLGF